MANESVVFPREIDVATVQEFGTALHRTIDDSQSRIVAIDLASVTFIGSAGFHALVEATEYARSRSRVISVRNLDPVHAGVLRLYDWNDELSLGP